MKNDMTAAHSVAAARAAFPCGLEQPSASYRFGLDALLLAAWAANRSGASWQAAAELGSGCGAALFGLLLHPSLSRRPARLLGLERAESLCRAARRNAQRLGFADICSFACGDLREKAFLRSCGMQRFDAVLANPPYGLPGSGRPSRHVLRERALREDAPAGAGTAGSGGGESLLRDFCLAAVSLLRHHGHFFCIFPAAEVSRLLSALREAGAGLRAMRPVHAVAGAPALRLLVEARKQAADDCRVLPSLVLHGSCRRDGPDWTAEARCFCPWLASPAEGGGAA